MPDTLVFSKVCRSMNVSSYRFLPICLHAWRETTQSQISIHIYAHVYTCTYQFKYTIHLKRIKQHDDFKASSWTTTLGSPTQPLLSFSIQAWPRQRLQQTQLRSRLHDPKPLYPAPVSGQTWAVACGCREAKFRLCLQAQLFYDSGRAVTLLLMKICLVKCWHAAEILINGFLLPVP